MLNAFVIKIYNNKLPNFILFYTNIINLIFITIILI